MYMTLFSDGFRIGGCTPRYVGMASADTLKVDSTLCPLLLPHSCAAWLYALVVLP